MHLKQQRPEQVPRIVVANPRSRHYLAAGLGTKLQIAVEGSVGYYVGTMMDGPSIRVKGNAGWFAGDNMTSGELQITGHAGNGLGQGIYGGTIAVSGDAGDRVGSLMKRGAILVGGDVGIMTGLYMMGGKIIVLGDLYDYAGESIIDGTLYFTGNVESLGRNAKVENVAPREAKHVLNLIRRYGFPEPRSTFQKITPEQPRPFYRTSAALPVKRAFSQYTVTLNTHRCNTCGACLKLCPQDVFKAIDDHVTAMGDLDCVNCRTCVEYCPTQAIRVTPTPNDADSTWNAAVIDRIRLKAASGHHLVRGTGARRRFPHFDDLVILCAQTSRPPIDHYREPCDTQTILGTRYAESPLKLNAPILVGALSFGAISREAKIAIATAASNIGIAVNTGEGGMLPEERERASHLIAQYASGRFGISARSLQSADAIEIKIGQGAKSGQGGLLLAEKVSDEIAAVRGIPVGTDAVSPARHLDIVGPEDLKMKIEQLREVTDWKIPIFVKYAAGRVTDDVRIAAKAGADAIVIDGKQAGTGAAPEIVLEHAGLPTLPALVEAHRALNASGYRDAVNLIVSGGIRNGADIAKAIALGADAVSMSTAILVAMGCTSCGLCSTGRCPKGITTQNPTLRQRLNIQLTASRVSHYLRAILEEVEMLTQLTGKTDVRNLDRDDLRALTIDAAAITGTTLAGR
jgi:glutamate synthase domain-containing protein 2